MSAITKTTVATTMTPSPTTTQSMWKPGSGSARRATPTGNSGDAATAPSTATSPPPAAMSSAWGPLINTRWSRVKPSERSVS